MLKAGGLRAGATKAKCAAPVTKMEADDKKRVLTAPYDMFKDLVMRSPEFVESIAKLGRPLRVATMCSGTESPLLALDMISRAVKEIHGVDFKVEHVFSCEIEPFKASYIQRNFSPPILFRDVRELGDEKATTAYGAMVDVPGEVDLLVAGTSCVDYSNLNNDKKTIDGGGESGQTFHGMLNWVRKNKPPLVILENVCSAPWESVVQRFNKNNYSAGFVRLDTKAHYIPHTRTRGYLFACLNGDVDVPGKWKSLIKKLECPSNSTLEAFLLPNDDPRIVTARANLAKSWDASRTRPRVDWSRCESRHHRARLEEGLGGKRPLTGWEDGGLCTLPDFAWNDWGQAQTDRVLDLMDINYMRMAKLGVDSCYKTLVWNLSQNVDRSTGSNKTGICPCLTPSMVPYITNRGGPVIGLEALSLQGIPVDDLLLTRETEDNMADLAGNAMTTTVVGTAMVAALALCIDGLRAAAWADDAVRAHEQKMDVDLSHDSVKIESVTELVSSPLTLTPLASASASVADIIDMAHRSSRMCCCEGRDSTSAGAMLRCSDCGHTCCAQCAGRPEHSYEEIAVERVSPEAFRKTLKDALPMILRFDVPDELEDALGGHFYFTALERNNAWRVRYTSTSRGTRLELIIRDGEAEWRAFTEAVWESDDDMGGASFARRKVLPGATSLLDGDVWEARDTGIIIKRPLHIEGSGERVDSWETIIGLQGEVAAKQRASELRVSGDIAEVCGQYRLLQKCGGALGMLHKRVDDDTTASPPVFLFIDPTRCGKTQDDKFVFSHTPERLEYGQRREIIAHLPVGWRMTEDNGDVTSTRLESWGSATLSLKAVECAATVSYPAAGLLTTTRGCEASVVCVTCTVPLLGESAAGAWGDSDAWTSITANNFRSGLAALAHVTERMTMPPEIGHWCAEEVACGPLCSLCAPQEPSMRWVKTSKGKVEPVEDIVQAGVYEQTLKRRPAPFVVQLKNDQEEGTGSLRVAINGTTLMHRAMGALQKAQRDTVAQCCWRVVPHTEKAAPLPSFTLTSNRNDDPYQQPPHFAKYQLRPEQLRSLRWMIEQEQTDVPFVEEEVCEAVGALGWRAEGRAQRQVTVSGGVLADEVGYGKTAVTLGLIDSAPKQCPSDEFGRVSLSATLIVAPPHLMKQWPSEITKFTASSLRVKLIKTLADISRITVSELQNADVVVVAATVFRSDLYFDRFTRFTGGKALPPRYGRMFDVIYKESLRQMGERVEWLKAGGQDGVRKLADALRAEEASRTAAGAAQVAEEEVEHFSSKKAAYAAGKRKGGGGVSAASDEAEIAPRRPVKKVKRTDNFALDKMLTSWESMTSPPLEMFKWQRIVVDEYTYLAGEDKLAVNSISAVSRWCLSGTPPTSSFQDVNGMASFLGISLGVSEPQRNRKDMTHGERFRFFQETNTPAWHERRHNIAQGFLDRFVRQNIAEIDEIPFEETTVGVTLPSAERAIYIELEAHLQALDMKSAKTIKSGKVANGDRDVRLRSILGSSATPEEALMKRCAHFDVEGGSESPAQACQVIVDLRWEQFRSCVRELKQSTMKARALRGAIVEREPEYEHDASDPFNRWVRSLEDGSMGDEEGGQLLHEEVVSAMNKTLQTLQPETGDADVVDMKFSLREAVHGLRRLAKEVVGRMRSLRYFKTVLDLQRSAGPTGPCAACGQPPNDLSILSTCGHSGCFSCVVEHADKQECCTDGCAAPARVTAVVKAKDLTGNSDTKSGRYGAKLTSVLETIGSIPAGEKILMFVQFADLMQLVCTALQESGIKALQLKGSVHTKTAAMEAFQGTGEVRVLLLDLAGESASGANLTIANHIMFLHPVLLPTPQECAAVETQAIGRVRRYGQTKPVKIWRFLASNTIDTDISARAEAMV